MVAAVVTTAVARGRGGVGGGWMVATDRQPEGEGRAGARLAPQADVTAVVGRHVLDDGEAEPGAAGRPRPGRVGPEEPFEHPLLVLVRDADAPVGDRDLGVAVGVPAADGH